MAGLWCDRRLMTTIPHYPAKAGRAGCRKVLESSDTKEQGITHRTPYAPAPTLAVRILTFNVMRGGEREDAVSMHNLHRRRQPI